MAYQLEGKVALITGGANGIGLETMELFQQHGAKVVSMDLVEQNSPVHNNLLCIKGDVSSEEDVNSAVRQTVEKFGRIDILLNVAGIIDKMQGVAEMDTNLWNRNIAIDLNGPMYLMRACIPVMMKNDLPHRGVIVSVSSVAAIRGAVAGAAYSTAKAALLALVRNTAWTYRNDGIRCSAVLPGFVETDILKNNGFEWGIGQKCPQELCHACAPGLCSPGDIAGAILYLATATSVNGAELVVDKGWMMA